MFEEEMARYDNKPIQNNTNTENEGKNVKTAEELNKEQSKDNNAEETLAAGVMGKLLNEVVFILEGDNESTTTPELRVENTAQQPPEETQIVNPEANKEITTEPQQFAQAMTNAETANNKQEAVNTEANTQTTGVNGEVMARMPDIRTKDSQDSAENNSKSFENGNLSPLENKNDETQTVGQNDKTYSAAADAVRKAMENEKSAAKDKPEPIISNNEIAPPLSEGIKAEQFNATQQMTQAALNTPVKTENLFEEMIQRVELAQNETKSTMSIQLNPEFLGKVALEVAVDAAGLHVKINAEDSGVRSMINGQLTALLESLENKGIAVAEVEVVYTGVNNGAFKEPGENETNQNRHYKPANQKVNSTEGVAYYTTLPDLFDFYQDVGVSSVEYRA